MEHHGGEDSFYELPESFYVPDARDHLLLIWEVVPETTVFYAIPLTSSEDGQSIDPEILDIIRGAHTQFVNSVGLIDNAERLNYMLAPSELGPSEDDKIDLLAPWKRNRAGCLLRYRMDDKEPLKGNFKEIVLSGFIL